MRTAPPAPSSRAGADAAGRPGAERRWQVWQVTGALLGVLLLVDFLFAAEPWAPWLELALSGAVLLLGREVLARGLDGFFRAGRVRPETFLALGAALSFFYSFLTCFLGALRHLDGAHAVSGGEGAPQLFFATAAASVFGWTLSRHLLAQLELAFAARRRELDRDANEVGVPLGGGAGGSLFPESLGIGPPSCGDGLPRGAALDARLIAAVSITLLAVGASGLVPGIEVGAAKVGLFIGVLVFGLPGTYSLVEALLRRFADLRLCQLGARVGGAAASNAADAAAGRPREKGALAHVAGIGFLGFKKFKTLTGGCPQVVDVIPVKVGISPEEILHLAAALVYRLEHPLRDAILLRSSESCRTIPQMREYKFIPGRGVRAIFQGQELVLGNLRFLTERGIPYGEVEDRVAALCAEGKTVLVLGSAEHVVGLLTVVDEGRQEGREVIGALRGLDITTAIFSGDNTRTLETLGAQLGVDEVHGEVTREETLCHLRGLRKAGRCVGLVVASHGDTPSSGHIDVGLVFGADRKRLPKTHEILLAGQDLREVVRLVRMARSLASWSRGAVACLVSIHAAAWIALVLPFLPWSPVDGWFLEGPRRGDWLTFLALVSTLLPAACAAAARTWLERRSGPARPAAPAASGPARG